MTRARKAARSWPHWRSLPASRRLALDAILAEAEQRGWTEMPMSERYLITIMIRHRGRGCSPATAHRVLADLRDAGWLILRREGCKIARLARRWALDCAALPQARREPGYLRRDERAVTGPVCSPSAGQGQAGTRCGEAAPALRPGAGPEP